MKKLIVMMMVLLIVGCAETAVEPTSEPISTKSDIDSTTEPTSEQSGTAESMPEDLDKGENEMIQFGTPFKMKIGEEREVGDMNVLFVQIVEDSRCPVDVNCFWEGQVGIELTIGSETVLLSSVREPEKSVSGHTIQFVGVEPGPTKSGQTIDSAMYEIELLIR